MITANVEDLAGQVAMTPAMRRALDWLASVRWADLPEGRVDIEGVDVYALVQGYMSKPDLEHPRWEAHEKYIDVQVVVQGRERFGWAPLAQMVPTDAYSPEKDVIHGTVASAAAVLVPLSAGQAMVLYPSDAHAPGLADGESSPVKKIVLKVKL